MSQIPTTSTKESLVILDNYPVDGASLNRTHKSRLKTLAAHIAVTMRRKIRVLGLNIYVVGHTDTTGTEAYNFDLGEARAQQAVIHLKALLISKGFDENNDNASRSKVGVGPLLPYIFYSVKSGGELTPVSTNEEVRGRGNNRRVEFSLEWVERIKPRGKIPKKTKNKKNKPQIPEPEKFISECWDAEKYLMNRQNLKKAIIIYHSTGIRYEDDKIFLTKRKQRVTTGNLLFQKLFDAFNNEYGEGRLKNGIQKWIDGKSKISNSFVGKVFGVIGHIQSLQTIKNYFKNERIMRSPEGEVEIHKKLACAAVWNEDLGTGQYWTDIKEDWDDLERLNRLCSIASGVISGRVTPGRTFGLPPEGIKRKPFNRYDFLNRGVNNRGF